jgi:hypothetical protein
MNGISDRIAKVQADSARLQKRADDLRKGEIADLRAELEGLEKGDYLTREQLSRKRDITAKLSWLENLELMHEAMAASFRV